MNIGNQSYLVGASTPSVLFDLPDLPQLDYPSRVRVPLNEGTLPREDYPRHLEPPKRSDKTRDLVGVVPLIILTALIFVTVITWLNVLSHWYEDTFNPPTNRGQYQVTMLALGYAALVTIITFIIFLIFYRLYGGRV